VSIYYIQCINVEGTIMKILIAEDDSTSSMILNTNLSKWDYEPIIVEDGEAAWKIMQQDDHPKLLLLDWLMPKLNGVELCSRIRDSETEDPSFIILLTSKTSTDDIVTGLEAGANEYIAKPFNMAELKARLQVGKRMLLLQEEQKKAERDRERLQRELAQNRKMKALSLITGGLAHDFNNILSIIMGYTTMSLDRFGNEMPERLKYYLLTSLKSSEGAKELVEKMITYTHGNQMVKAEPINLSNELRIIQEKLQNKLPDSISIECHEEMILPDIVSSPEELWQLIDNVCDNAKDAMSAEGIIKIDIAYTKNVQEECLICHKEVEGDWVELSISDHGTGMTTETMEHMFEPFFTTKELGKGMGMAMSHGIIKRIGGHCQVESTVGEGSNIRIFFPPAK